MWLWWRMRQLAERFLRQFQYQMNDQLRRIREKDYSEIDQKLFATMANTEKIGSTLSHLSEFQKFLMEQISCLNHPSRITGAANLTSSISKNFQSLRESLIKCSRVINSVDRKSVGSLKQSLAAMEQCFSSLKMEVRDRIEEACAAAKRDAESAVEQVVIVWERERARRMEVEKRCEELERQRQRLIAENTQLKQVISQSQVKKSILIGQQNTVNINILPPFDEFTAKNKDLREINATPLKEQRLYFNQLQPSYSQKSKIIKDDLSQSKMIPQPRRNSLARLPSTHMLNSKSNLTLTKENQMLLSKGVVQERGRSRQKIKVFSMI